MTASRPLIAVRLIGPAETVNAQKTYLRNYLLKLFRDRSPICRTSTHPASNTGEIRAYITVTAKESP